MKRWRSKPAKLNTPSQGEQLCNTPFMLWLSVIKPQSLKDFIFTHKKAVGKTLFLITFHFSPLILQASSYTKMHRLLASSRTITIVLCFFFLFLYCIQANTGKIRISFLALKATKNTYKKLNTFLSLNSAPVTSSCFFKVDIVSLLGNRHAAILDQNHHL